MGKKLMGWKTKGMNQDLSVSAFNPEFSFENMNLRLSTNEGNTLMSWVNEKGTKRIPVKIDTNPWYETENKTYAESITGGAIGTAVLNNQLVVFTTCPQHIVMNGNQSTTIPKHDYIYVFTWRRFPVVSEQEDDEEVEGLFGRRIYAGNLNFDEEHPLETLVSYEAEHIQKVYWTDGINQPRMINIAASNEKLERWNHPDTADIEHEGVPSEEVETFFDFVPTIDLSATLSITQEMASSGTFAPGVIQYCFTYFNKHGQQSNVIEVSPLYYLAHEDRGASPEDKVTCSFTIQISGLDANFDCVRIYSIQRTSLNLEPVVKILEDIPIEGSSITYIDNGTTGALIDPTELLFIGGKEIKVLTMTDKDNTLFMGNIEQNTEKLDTLQAYLRSNPLDVRFYRGGPKTIELDHTDGIYGHTNMLKKNHREITTFKGGEQYRFGFQLQKPTGEWTEPIWIRDKTNDLYPLVNKNTGWDNTQLVYASTYRFKLADIPQFVFDFSKYKKIRPVIVYPTISDRKVLCQGVLNPTVFNALDRIDNSPYAQASWYFRPYATNKIRTQGGNSQVTPYETVTVLSSTLSNTPDLTLDPESLVGHVREVYVLKASFDGGTGGQDAINSILQRGSLKTHVWKKITEDGISKEETSDIEQSFIGAFKKPNSNEYFFVKDSPWLEETTEVTPAVYTRQSEDTDYGSDAIEGYIVEYTDVNLTYEGTERTPFQLYNKMAVVNGLLVFSDNTDLGNNVTSIHFKFYIDNTFYDVTFEKTSGSITNDISSSYPVNTKKSGDAIAYTHYESLATAEDAAGSDSTEIEGKVVYYDNREKAKKVEIQGSRKSFLGVFDTNNGELTSDQIASNTQFFVDQSIVTLNSPDLEFDTEVQRWGTDHLHLRVIGAIPITANASDHKISISSSMLEINHNVKENSLFNILIKSAEENISYKEAKSILDETLGKDPSFGDGELTYNVRADNVSTNAGRHLVAEYLWKDVVLKDAAKEEDKIKTLQDTCTYLIHPWHRSASLNNDWRSADVASSLLKWKKESNLLYSINTCYFAAEDSVSFENIGVQIPLTENAEVMNYRLPKQISGSSEINYYPNIDKVLYNKKGYKLFVDTVDADIRGSIKNVTTPVAMRYKSTTHAAISLGGSNGKISLLPYAIVENNTTVLPPVNYGEYTGSGTTFWGDTVDFYQDNINITDATDMLTVRVGSQMESYDFLWLGELYKDVTNAFGGDSDAALRANKWVVGGNSVTIPDDLNDEIPLTWTDGDTYYQRYDCLKTYAYTNEDPNQLVEILSFMCESHVNIDGRYDRNRGQLKNYLMRPEIFNLLNPVYSQQDNFFTSRKTDIEKEETLKYPNHVAYSQTKTSGADVDEWTHLTLASILEMDGDKGEVKALKRLNDSVICFQDTGIAQILYNDNVAISTTAGVPIELANSGKVQGKRYLSDTIGCSNKWSIAQSPLGIYFIDSNGKDIYLFNGQLDNLSTKYGFNSWCKEHISQGVSDWNPKDFGWNEDIDKSNFVSYYDKKNQEVLFINLDTALAFSEKIGAFTSFYNYGGIPYYCNFNDRGIWLTYNLTTPTSSTNPVPKCELWEHQAGEYCQFFGVNYPYWMTLVGNQEPQMDKTFTNLEFRATIDGDGVEEQTKFVPTLPFDYLEAWDEYQHGIAQLQNKNGHGAMQHHLPDTTATLKRKFRIWRCDIPRDNCDVDNTIENPMGIYRFRKRPLDRMRNPWIYLKLMKDAAEQGAVLNRTEIHDLIMTYFT